jgi:hypothetical protein
MPPVVPFIAAIANVGLAVGLPAVGLYATAALTVAAATAIVAGANALIKGMMPDVSMPQSDTDRTRQQTVRGTIEPQKVVYGEALVSGPIFFVGVAGTDNKDLYHAVALTAHECESVTDIYFDKTRIADASITGNAVTAGDFGPTTEAPLTTICFVERKTGTSTQAVSSLLSASFTGWTANHQARGIAYIVTKWRLTDSSQEMWDRLTPRDIKALVKGKKDIYDPRLDVAAGNSAGANPNSATYQAWSENPALCVANYLTDTKFGLSVATNKIDWAAVVTAANACDATVAVPSSATEKRFTANGVLYATDTHRANINKLLSAMNGTLVYANGIYTIGAGAYAAPTESLDENDLAGAITVKTSVERGERFNTIRPIFIDPAQQHKSVEAPEVQQISAVLRDANEVLIRDVQLPFTNTSFMAQRIAFKQISLSDQQKVLTFPANLKGLRVQVGDRVSVTVEELNYSNKVFRCAGLTFSDTQDGVVNLTLLEDDSTSYADPTASQYSTVSPTGVITDGFRGVPDPQNLTASAGLKHIELNWTNPANPKAFETIAVYASADSSWSNAQLIGETRGTQFFHDSANPVDPITVGLQRYYWVRAFAYKGDKDSTQPFIKSDRNPDTDSSTVVATVGPNNPDYSDIVDNTPAQDAPTSLTLTETTVLGNDGSVLPAVRVAWTAPTNNTYVNAYEVEFKRTSASQIDYGQVTDSYTATIDYGSVADATTLELNYGGVNEAVTDPGAEFSSVLVYGTSTTIAGQKELEEHTFRVRAVTVTGRVSGFITNTLTLQGDQTAPAIPSSITATGGIQQIKLNFSLPSDSDLAFVEIFENTVDNRATSTLIVKTKSDQHTVTGLGNSVTRYYWLRSADRSGNLSGFSASFSATTQKIVLDDFAQDVLDEFAAGDAFGIEPVSTLSGVTGAHVGQIKLLTTTDTLFVWTGSAWSEDIFTASSVDPGSITAASFASGVEPVSVVTSLPSPTGYTGPKFVFNTGDSPPKIYRYNSAVPEFTSLVNAADLTGTLAADRFSNTVRPVEVVSSLPTTGNFQGRVVLLSTDNKVYRFTGTSFSKAISASDLDDQVNLATQVFGQVQASSLTAGQISSESIQTGAVVADSIASGAISAVKLAADSVTANAIAANAVTASEIAANTITSAQINTSQVFADTAIIGAIQSGSITTSAVVSAIGSFEFIQTANIAANQITGGLIAASTIDASKLNVTDLAAISADLGAVTAGSINASQVTVSNINGSNITSGTVPTAQLDVTGIISAGGILVGGDNISALNNDTSFITGDEVNTNVTAISGGVITTGTINANRINIDNVTLDTDGAGQLVIHAAGVDTAQIKNNAVSNAASAFTAGNISVVNSDNEVTIQTVSHTATGASVLIFASFKAVPSSGRSHSVTARVKRSGSTIFTQTLTGVGETHFFSFSLTDFSASAGSVTYTLTAENNGTSPQAAATTSTVSSRSLALLEVKK